MATQMTLRSVLSFIIEHAGCTVNDVLEAHGLPLDPATMDDAEYFDREYTGAALLQWLTDEDFVTYVVTSFDGWKYTATGKTWR